MALKKCNTNFPLEYFIPKNKTTFSDFPLLPEMFRWEDLKSRVPFTFQPDFPETFFVNGKQPLTPDDPQCKKVSYEMENGSISFHLMRGD